MGRALTHSQEMNVANKETYRIFLYSRFLSCKKIMSEKCNDRRDNGLLRGRLTSFRKFAQSFVAVLQVIGPFSDQRFQDWISFLYIKKKGQQKNSLKYYAQ